MNSLYKRLVTIGMISFTALLGWIYCIIEFRNKPVYIVLVSLALIVSVYVLLQSIISLRQRKDIKLKKDINEAVAKLVADFYEAQSQTETPDNTLEVERICKALYVQLRKVNTTLSNDLITKELLNNATKVNIKYHHADSTKLLAAITDLSDTLKLAPEPQVIVKEIPVAAPAPVSASAEAVKAPESEPVAMPEPIAKSEPEVVAESTTPADDGGMLSQAEMDALIANMTSFAPEETEKTEIQTETQIETPANVGASSEEAQHFFDEFETKHERNNEQTEPNAAAEPEPVSGPEPVASAPADDGGMLSQAEMDALIASMTGGSSEPEPEPAPEPEPVASAPADDGGMLSQAEMDALIASMTGGSSEPEPEPETPSNVLEFPTPTPAPAPEPAPVSDDPNKVLSPEEIAALFNSMK